MADSLPFAATPHYAPASYYSTPHMNHDPVRILSQPARTEASQQRKRPKYTRSKTGCLTCRVKKIKCDETKPNCMRCTHSQRDCTWPEGVPARKKAAPRKDSTTSLDARPSTASSSASSTPSTRNPTPPRRMSAADYGLLPVSRRSSDPYLQLHPLPEPARRTYLDNDRSSLYMHPTTANIPCAINMIPETNSYRYDQFTYSNTPPPLQPSRHSLSTGLRPANHHHQALNHWDSPEPIDSYFPALPERALVGHAPLSDSHTRY